MALNTNASRLYVVKETTPGTLLKPSAGDQAMALQPGFQMDSAFDQQQSEELKAGIGPSASIPGIERPTFNWNHYLRGSATPGVKPDYHLIWESLMGSVRNFYSEMVVSNANNKINFEDDDGVVAGTVVNGTYKTPQELAAAVTTAMNAANGNETALCVYSTVTGKFTITSTGTLLSLLWKTGANGSDNTDTHIGTLLGYSDAADDTGTAAGTGYAADNATNGIERVTDTGSTTTLLEVTANCPEILAGSAVLVQDGSNGFSARGVSSKPAADQIEPNFALPGAPAAGVALGRCVSWIPANSGHPLLSFWLYHANGGAISAMAGGQVTSMDISLAVGELLNMAFVAGGTQYMFNPILITATNKFFDFNDGGVKVAQVPEGWYRSPVELATALQDAINAASAIEFTVVYNSYGASKGKFTLTAASGTFSILWQSGANAANSIGTTLGFLVAANDTGSLTYTSDNVQSYADALTPDLDDSEPLVAKDMEVLFGDQANFQSLCVQTMDANISNTVQDVECLNAQSGVDSKVVQGRTNQIDMVIVLEQHEVDFFDRFVNNRDAKFQFTWGAKSGGNWIPGRVGLIWSDKVKVTSATVGDNNGVQTRIVSVAAYMDSAGNPELYANQL